jgi:DNA polymerase-3 subunit delta'
LLKQEIKLDDLPWLEGIKGQLGALLGSGKCPHALLIHGRAGTGRRQLALWFAETMLGFDPFQVAGLTADFDSDAATYPDLCVLQPLRDKKTQKLKKSIGIDQIRETLINEFLHLSSHGSAGRLVLIWPAERMTIDAANCLLKSLEEPPDGVILVLITDSIRKLPATVVSRCQRVRVAIPAREQAMEWLQSKVPGADLGNLLDFAGGAPLAALDLHGAAFTETAGQYAQDLRGLEQRQLSPVEVAGRWQANADLALRWLDWRLSRRVRSCLEDSAGKAGGVAARAASSGAAQQTLQACFRQMTQIRELRRLLNGGINAELSIAGLLMDWYGGFGRP